MDLGEQIENKTYRTADEPVLRYDHISQEVITAIQNAFHLFDKNGDGKITADELKSVIDSLLIPQTTTRADVDKMIEEADTDGNGTVEFEEFFRIMNHFMAEQDPDAEIVEAFQLFDHDKNGFIDHEELKKTMQRLGESLNDDDVDAMMRSADLNADGRIDFQEFKQMMYQRNREPSVSSVASQASCSSVAFESSASASGSASPLPFTTGQSLSVNTGGRTSPRGTNGDSNVPDSNSGGMKRKLSANKRLFAKSSSTETRPPDLLNVNVEKKEKTRRPSWSGLRNLLKKS